MPKYDPQSLAARAAGRIANLPRRLDIAEADLRGKRLLEVGCGNGECTAAAIEILQCEAVGIDPFPRWPNGPYAHLAQKGILLEVNACDQLAMAEIGSFDFVHSYTVLEHIDRPFQALANIYDLLKPGGRVFLSFNLHLGASASHLAGYLPDMPWIHLTHTEEEARAIMMHRHGIDRGFSWVNKWRSRHYLDACRGLGFDVQAHFYTRKEVDSDFYAQHHATLGKYDKRELAKNFMHMRLEKKPRGITHPSAI